MAAHLFGGRHALHVARRGADEAKLAHDYFGVHPGDTELDAPMRDLIGYVHSYEVGSTMDGPGLRFVVFLTGCVMRCQFCHNPDTWHKRNGQMITMSRAMKTIGRFAAALKSPHGGITISGGEPMVQLLPLGLGMALRWWIPDAALRIEPRLRRVGTVLLLVLVTLALIDVHATVIGAGPRVATAIVVATALALVTGHLLGGPSPGTRTATAISSASRNAGLALLVAALNHAIPAIVATVLAYFVLSAMTVIAYALWRRRKALALAN